MSLEAFGDGDDGMDGYVTEERAEEAFVAGARACREMMARFVEEGCDAATAMSIRANWHPDWGKDPGRPASVQTEAFADVEDYKIAEDIFGPAPRIAGTLDKGTYIQVGMGLGFYVPDEAFRLVKAAANQTHQVQFLTVTKDGQPIHGTREECQQKGDGCIAWIMPDTDVQHG